jgi:hypothetical protein
VKIYCVVAALNQGNSEYGSASSSSSINIQTQWLETVVTSAPKVVVPGISNLLLAGLNEALCIDQCFLTTWATDMDAHTTFFP